MITKHRTGTLVKRGSRYYVRCVVEGKVISQVLRDESGKAITTKRDAELAKEKFMAPFSVATKVEALQSLSGMLTGGRAELAELEDQRNPPLALAQAWTEFIASPNRPDSGGETLYQYECQWSAFVDWMKEKHPEVTTLRGVTTEIAEEYASTLNGGRFSPNTYNKHLNLLTLVFRVVKRKARFADNPWQDIQRKRLVTHSRRELTIDELRKVCQSATGELKTLLALGVYSGLRLGDCATLRWAETDLRRGMITRIPNKTARRNPKPVVVPIHPTLGAILGEIPANQRGEYVLPEMAGLYAKRIDLVTDRVQSHFKTCGIQRHKPDTGKNGQRAVLEVGFHSLRHSFVSMCRASNVPLSVVEALVGHNSPQMTKVYTHTGELAASNAVALLPAVVGDATPTPESRNPEAILREAQGIAHSLTGKNWRKKRAALLAVLAGTAKDGQATPKAGN